MKRALTVLASALCAGWIAAASPAAAPVFAADATPAPAVVVHIKDFAYKPPTVTIRAGQAVLFINDDGDAHTVSATDKSFDSGGLDTNERWSHTFAKPGTYAYFCELHPYMKGTIVVTPAQ